MQRLRSFLSYLGPVLLIGALGAFVVYSLVLYQPSGHLACSSNFIARQADVAVHVVRQWAGKASETYVGCTP